MVASRYNRHARTIDFSTRSYKSYMHLQASVPGITPAATMYTV